MHAAAVWCRNPVWFRSSEVQVFAEDTWALCLAPTQSEANF